MVQTETEKITRDEYGAVRDAGTLLRVAGGIGAGVTAVLVASNGFAWLGAMMSSSYEMADTLSATITEHSLRLVVFLFAYAAGTALSAFARPIKRTRTLIEKE